jgi:hypothetical protein
MTGQLLALKKLPLLQIYKITSMNTTRSFSSKSLGLTLVALLAGLTTANASVINVTVDSAGALYNGVGVATKDEYGYDNNTAESNLGFLNTVIVNYNTFNNPDLPGAVGPVGADFGSLGGVNSYETIGGYDYVVMHYGTGEAAFGDAPAWVPEVVVPPVYHPAEYKPNGSLKKAAYTEPGYTIPGHLDETTWHKSSGGWWAAFYIGGTSGISFNVPIPGPAYGGLVYNGESVGGFSSARYFNSHREPPPPMVPDAGSSAALLGLGLVAVSFLRRKIS